MDRVIAARAEAMGVTFEEMRNEYLRKISLRRMVEAKDVANWLCSRLRSGAQHQRPSHQRRWKHRDRLTKPPWSKDCETEKTQGHHLVRHYRLGAHAIDVGISGGQSGTDRSTGDRAARAGAAILHLHARNSADGSPTPDPAVFEQFVPKIAAQTDAIINITTGGSSRMTLDDRLAYPLVAKPELCSLNMGSMNFAFHKAGSGSPTGSIPGTGPYQRFGKRHLPQYVRRHPRHHCTARRGVRHAIRVRVLRRRAHLQPRLLRQRGLLKPPLFLQCCWASWRAQYRSGEPVLMRSTADRLLGRDNYEFSVLERDGARCPWSRWAQSWAAMCAWASRTVCISGEASWRRRARRRCSRFVASSRIVVGDRDAFRGARNPGDEGRGQSGVPWLTFPQQSEGAAKGQPARIYRHGSPWRSCCCLGLVQGFATFGNLRVIASNSAALLILSCGMEWSSFPAASICRWSRSWWRAPPLCDVLQCRLFRAGHRWADVAGDGGARPRQRMADRLRRNTSNACDSRVGDGHSRIFPLCRASGRVLAVAAADTPRSYSFARRCAGLTAPVAAMIITLW